MKVLFNDLQRQLLSLYKKISDKLGNNITPDFLMDNSLGSIFFRSYNSETFQNKNGASAFCLDLWSFILQHMNPAVIVCYDLVSYRGFIIIFEKQGYFSREIKKRTEWGNTNYFSTELLCKRNSLLLFGLPHISRYKIFCGKEKYNLAVEDIASQIADKLRSLQS